MTEERDDAVVLEVMRACTARELCCALGFSRGVRNRVLARGALVCDGRALGYDAVLVAASEVSLSLETRRGVRGSKVGETSLGVLWHDRFALAADKPQGLLVHGDGTDADTLSAWVQDAYPTYAVQAVQRLDVDTSGIVLFSLAEEFQPAFDLLVAGHAMHKRYLAVVEGRLSGGRRVIDAPIARDRHDARRMRVGSSGKPAQTVVVPLAYGRGRTLMGCELRSGRRHQIRVHLAHMGYPIVGDALYGRASCEGLMLHAFEESFVHPVTGRDILLRTDWPHRFSNLFSPRELDWSILNR